MKSTKHKGNPDIASYGFKKGNQLGCLGKGISKFGNFTNETSYKRLTNILDRIPEDEILARMNQLDTTNFCFLYLKLAEMKINHESKIKDIELKRELNQSTNQNENDVDIVSIKLVKGNQSN